MGRQAALDDKNNVSTLGSPPDDTLRDLGLKPVRAWVRDGGRASGAARRKAKQRNRQREEGIRQLNLDLPADKICRQTFRSLARAVTEGAVTTTMINALLAPLGLTGTVSQVDMALQPRDDAR